MDPSAPLSKQQYVGTLKQWHKQIRASYRRDIKDAVSVADDDSRLIEMNLLRALLSVAKDRIEPADEQ